MTEKEIIDSYQEICSYIASRRLKDAFDLLDLLIFGTETGEFRDQFQMHETNYKYMLKYTVEGINDPERQKVYDHLVKDVYRLCDTVKERLMEHYSGNFFYVQKRGIRQLSTEQSLKILHEMEELHEHAAMEDLVSKTVTSNAAESETDFKLKTLRNHLFRIFWLVDTCQEFEIKTFKAALDSHSLPLYEKALLVSSVTLGLLHNFDPEKFHLLFDAFQSDEISLKQRALVGLLFAFYKYDKRLTLFRNLTGRWNLLNEDPAFKRNVEAIIIQLIRTKETEKISKKLQDEILPEMARISPNLRNKMDLDKLMEEGLGEDKNPEWMMNILDETPDLRDKMMELTEMQLEGADVFMSSFSMLKSFPFFQEIAHWFLPYTTKFPDVKRIYEKESNHIFLDNVFASPIMCNSDKYSFTFSIENIPNDYKDMISSSLNAEAEQLEEMRKDGEAIDPETKAKTISNQYIQDLYRFFKLFPQKGFEDIFNWKFDFHNKLFLKETIAEDPKVLGNIAEYFFSKNDFESAEEIYGLLLKQEKENGEQLQKRAFCQEKMGNYQLALEYYLKAELYDLNRKWNLKKIANCYRKLKQPQKALEYYEAVEALEPDSLSLQLNIGHCYLEQNNFEEALKCYFKVEYLTQGSPKVWRPIGWCSFLVGKFDQAERYYQKIIEDNPNQYDWMNAGHIQWVKGNRQEALDYYKKSVQSKDYSIEKFMKNFDDDIIHLTRQGVNSGDIPIMLDQLRYSL